MSPLRVIAMFVLFTISDGTLGHDILCVAARQEGSDNDNHVELAPCDWETDFWDYDPRLAQLQHQPSGQCLKVRVMMRYNERDYLGSVFHTK